MGVSMVFSFNSRGAKYGFLRRLYQVIRRSAILFGLGLFLNNGYELHSWRIPGVLQRFGVSYLAVALTELVVSTVTRRIGKVSCPSLLKDLTNNWVQLLVAVCLVIINQFITFLLPVEGCPTGYLGPGGIGDHGNYFNCTGGAALRIDRWIFGTRHIYQHPTCLKLYHTGPFEPEGTLGALNSIALCFLGLQAGKILFYHSSHTGRIVRLLTWGLILGLVGAGFSGFRKNGGLVPINKNLWSLSFILVMGGTANIMLIILYLLIDVTKRWNGVPFVYPGMNSILVYCGSELLQGYFPFSWYQEHETHLGLLLSNLIGVSLWIFIAYYCYRQRFFVKI